MILLWPVAAAILKAAAKAAVKGMVTGTAKSAAMGAIKGTAKSAAMGAIKGATKSAATGAVKGAVKGATTGAVKSAGSGMMSLMAPGGGGGGIMGGGGGGMGSMGGGAGGSQPLAGDIAGQVGSAGGPEGGFAGGMLNAKVDNVMAGSSVMDAAPELIAGDKFGPMGRPEGINELGGSGPKAYGPHQQSRWSQFAGKAKGFASAVGDMTGANDYFDVAKEVSSGQFGPKTQDMLIKRMRSTPTAQQGGQQNRNMMAAAQPMDVDQAPPRTMGRGPVSPRPGGRNRTLSGIAPRVNMGNFDAADGGPVRKIIDPNAVVGPDGRAEFIGRGFPGEPIIGLGKPQAAPPAQRSIYGPEWATADRLAYFNRPRENKRNYGRIFLEGLFTGDGAGFVEAFGRDQARGRGQADEDRWGEYLDFEQERTAGRTLTRVERKEAEMMAASLGQRGLNLPGLENWSRTERREIPGSPGQYEEVLVGSHDGVNYENPGVAMYKPGWQQKKNREATAKRLKDEKENRQLNATAELLSVYTILDETPEAFKAVVEGGTQRFMTEYELAKRDLNPQKMPLDANVIAAFQNYLYLSKPQADDTPDVRKMRTHLRKELNRIAGKSALARAGAHEGKTGGNVDLELYGINEFGGSGDTAYGPETEKLTPFEPGALASGAMDAMTQRNEAIMAAPGIAAEAIGSAARSIPTAIDNFHREHEAERQRIGRSIGRSMENQYPRSAPGLIGAPEPASAALRFNKGLPAKKSPQASTGNPVLDRLAVTEGARPETMEQMQVDDLLRKAGYNPKTMTPEEKEAALQEIQRESDQQQTSPRFKFGG